MDSMDSTGMDAASRASLQVLQLVTAVLPCMIRLMVAITSAAVSVRIRWSSPRWSLVLSVEKD